MKIEQNALASNTFQVDPFQVPLFLIHKANNLDHYRKL